MTIDRKTFGELAEAILEVGMVKAVKFFSETLRVKATRRLVNGKKIDKRFKDVEILFTVGPPNFYEKRMIRNALKKDKRFLKNRSLVCFPYKGGK